MCTGTLPLLLPDLTNIFASNIFQPTRLTSAMAALFAEEAAQEGITCSYAGIEGWRDRYYSERTEIESV
ncbi:MAG: hypothetical protein QOG58_322 [Caballeronia sp.]|nr:hypothetical protein [Caballeronia sp.]